MSEAESVSHSDRVAPILLDALAELRRRDTLEEILDDTCAAVVALGDFRAAVLSFYVKQTVGYGAAGGVPEGIKERFREGYLKGTPEGRRARRRALWNLRRPGTRIVFVPAGEGPPPSSVFIPSGTSAGTWHPDDRLLILCPGIGGVSFADDLFAVLSVDMPTSGDRPDEAVFARLQAVERFLSNVAVHVENFLMRQHLETSERQNREILAALPSSVALLDREGRVLMASPGAGRGAAPELVAGGSLLDVDWPPDVRAGLEALLLDGVALPPAEARVTLLSGERDILLRGTPTSGDRTPLGEDAAVAVIAVEDVTELRAMQSHLRRAEKLHAIGRLASGVAHDFNNMLTGVIGSLSLAGMETREQDVSLRELLRDARAAAERGAVLTRQLQAFARPSEHLDPEPVDIAAVTARVVELLSRTVDPRIEISVDAHPQLPPVMGDERLLEHALIHVGTNACEAVAARLRRDGAGVPTAVRIEMTADPGCPAAQPHGSVSVTVRDTGIGMDGWTLGQAFEPFFTRDESGRHPGIGLTLARSVVQRHGGTVELLSEPDAGTTFRACLPAAAALREREPVPERAGARVLVVDDDAAVASVICRMLERAGHRPVNVASGEAAIAALRAAPCDFDAMVLDLTMPGLNGDEMLRRLAKEGIRVPPVLLSTGDPSRFEGLELDTLGVTAYLPKPYRPEALQAAVARLVA